MGRLLTTLWSVDGPGDRDDLLRRAEAHAARALALQPRHVRGHYVRGMVHQARQRFDEALAEFDITVGLAPNFGPVHARRAWVMSSIDRPEQALAGFARAMRISPRDPWVGGWHNGSAFASQMLGRDEDALAHAVRAVAASQGLAETHLNLAAAYALLGRSEEARHALAEYRRLRPDATTEGLRRRWREWSEHPLFVATRDRQIEALRAIGLPER